MNSKAIIIVAIIGAIINFCSRRISEKTGIAELTVKIFSLIVVLLAIVLMFVI